MAGQFDLQQSFPISGVAQLLADRTTKEAAMKAQQQQQLVEGLKMFGSGVQSLVDRRNAMAQALAIGKTLNVPQEQSSQMSPEQVLSVGKELQPISVPYMDKDGRLKILSVPKGSKGLPSQGTGNLQQVQGAVDSDGTPLLVNPKTGDIKRANVPPGVKPVAKKGDEGAITDTTLLANQIPNIKTMFDAYRTSKSPRLQSTPAGRLMDPSGKQAENSLKLAAFTFGGKNLTGQEKDVVFGALFPSWTDDEQSRTAKEQLLTNYMTGKIDLMEAANLLGPAGGKLREVLTKYQGQQTKTQTSPQVATAKLSPPSDLVHLSTKELMELRKKMTAHKENDSQSK